MASISYLQVKQNATSVRAVVVMESTSAGVVVASLPTSLVYFRDGDTSATTVALTAGTLGTWASATAVIVTGMTGYYEIGIPNAVFANAVRQVSIQSVGSSAEGSLLIQIAPQELAVGVYTAGGLVGGVSGSVGSVLSPVGVNGYSGGADPYRLVMQTVDSVDALTNADTLEKRIRIITSALLGKVSGMGTNAPIFRNVTDTKPRITATTDSIGNRTAVTLDGS